MPCLFNTAMFDPIHPSRHRTGAQHRPAPHRHSQLPLGPTSSGQPLPLRNVPHRAHLPTRRTRVPPILPVPLLGLGTRVYTHPGQEPPTTLRLGLSFWIPIGLDPASRVVLIHPPDPYLPLIFRRRPVCAANPRRVAGRQPPECPPSHRPIILRSRHRRIPLTTICRELRLVERHSTSVRTRSRPAAEGVPRSRRGGSSSLFCDLFISDI